MFIKNFFQTRTLIFKQQCSLSEWQILFSVTNKLIQLQRLIQNYKILQLRLQKWAIKKHFYVTARSFKPIIKNSIV